jgi:two-component system nitrogen regulation sensor histidine kinase GlnL
MRNASPLQSAPMMAEWAGLELVPSGVVILDERGRTRFLNPMAEQLLGVSVRAVVGQMFSRLFLDGSAIEALLADQLAGRLGIKHLDLRLERIGRDSEDRPVLGRDMREGLQFESIAVALDASFAPFRGVLLELREIDQRLRVDREERLLQSTQVSRELVRNLAHEIKNPLGGIRGAAQLLEAELPNADLREYTGVIIKEADRLQTLVDRLLAPHRVPRIVDDVNIHEVCERVRSVVLAEFPVELEIRRDYDASLPEFRGDKEQLIQALLNLVRNAAQAMSGGGTILLRTRVARQVTIARQRFRLALDLHVIDEGPGVPESIRDRIFLPLVSGRDGGSGLGLPLAQTFVQQHLGTIECDSRPGRTDFRVRLPLPCSD